MSDTLNLVNSIWPNGMKVDSDGHALFYPLGTKKKYVPASSSQWPKGTKLVSPFVYDKNDKLVGFVDTKALTVSKNTTICLPYEHIEAEFSAINKGQLQIHAPNAITKKASWKDSKVENIPEVQFKYKGCKNKVDVKNIQYDFLADIANGTWSEHLWDLTNADAMFSGCTALTSFSSDLPSLTNSNSMFYECTALTSFKSDLPSLTNSFGMFSNCYNLTSFNGDLSSLTNGTNMFENCSNLKSFNGDLSSLTDGTNMFYRCENLASFKSNLSSLINGSNMFNYCENLASFKSNLSSLTEGSWMFLNCSKLSSFISDLSSLTEGYGMFYSCENLTSFTSDLPNLTDGTTMFYSCKNLPSFKSNLPSLTNGERMFSYCIKFTSFSSKLPSLKSGRGMFSMCKNLTTFNSNLSKLTIGTSMFANCDNFTSFKSDLSSLTNGDYMFDWCKLDTASVQNIADTINTYNGTIHIGIGNSEPNEQEEAAFNKMVSKGWTVYVKGNGSSSSNKWNPTSLTPIDGEETTTPIPFWAKPVPSDEEYAKYVDEQGNFFNILGGQFIYGDDISTYGMFTCEEDAAANMRLTPYIKPQTEIEKQ